MYARALMDPVKGIPLSNHRVRLTTYKSCFTGVDAISWFMSNLEGITSLELANVGIHVCDYTMLMAK